MEIVHAIFKLGIRTALVCGVLFYGTCYVTAGVANHCWNPIGCINPADVAHYEADRKLQGAYPR